MIPDILYAVLQNNLDDFDRFKAYVYGFMRELEELSDDEDEQE